MISLNRVGPVALFLVLISGHYGLGGTNQSIISIDVTSPPETYPYAFRESKAGPIHGNVWCSYQPLDFMGDSLDEVAGPSCNDIGGGTYRSSLLLYDNPKTGICLWERSQEFSGGIIKGMHCTDLLGNEKEDICLIRQLDTVLFLDIFHADDSGIVIYNRIPAAVIPGWARDSGWHTLTINPLAGIDLNGDGNRDLIISRHSRINGDYMRDSAFTRGMIAWDISGDSLLWFLPLPDEVGMKNLLTIRDSLNEPHFVFLKGSNNNPYVASGMSSGEAFLIGIDKNGKVQWRQLIGTGFYGGIPFMLDSDTNGVPEVYVVLDGKIPENNGYPRLAKFDPFSGNLLDRGISLRSNRIPTLTAIYDSKRKQDIVLAVSIEPDNRSVISIYDAKLNCLSAATAELGGGIEPANLIGDSRPELIGGTCQSRMAILDLDLNVLAVSEFAWLPNQIGCLMPDGPGFVLENQVNRSFRIITVYKQAFGRVFYARYRWWLAVGLALLLFTIMYRFIVWISRLYRSAAGLPSLDKINTAVIVMNRKGRILYANKTRLNAALLGGNKANGGAFSETPLGQNPAAGEILRKYAADPFVPIQGRLEYEIDGSRRQVELSVFPRTDENLKNIIGSIVVVEDISEKAAWNRKVVMGEAAQKWVHRLKGNMATAKIILENMNEDPRLAEFVKNSPVCLNYLNSLKDRIIETAQHSEKILRYVRITHPEPVPTDLNQLVERLTGEYQKTTNGKIVVAKEPQPGLPLIMVDPDQMVEVLDNLLSNAIDSLRDEGRITIITRMADHLHNKKGGDSVELIVKDNGRGISPEDIDKIFTPGFTKSGRGTGLGLAIVKEIVHNHGGKIEVTSEIDKGTEFTISLPANFQE